MRDSRNGKGKPVASFENYCWVIGGILETCGIAGFLDNRHITSRG